MDRNLIQYLPGFIKKYKEIQSIAVTEQAELEQLEERINYVLNNSFIDSADEDGIKRLENIMGITSDKAMESLSFRRERIKNRFLMFPPFTVRYLKQQLDATIGQGMYELVVDHNHYVIYLESSAVNQSWYNEILFTIQQVKPCNMIFVNKPLLTDTISLEEEQKTYKLDYCYQLGSWVLGEKPFAEKRNQTVIKKGGAMSIQQEFLEDIAGYVSNAIDKIQLNNEVIISDFEVKEATSQTVSVEYTVKNSQVSSGNITNVKLMSKDNRILSDAMVYVPVTEDVLVKHTIKVKEGASC